MPAVESPNDGRESDPRPIVILPRSGPPGAIIGAIGAAFAILLFVALNARRLERTETRAPTASDVQIADPQALVVPRETPPVTMLAVEPLPNAGPQPMLRMRAPVATEPTTPDPPSVASQPSRPPVPYPSPPAPRRATGSALVYDSGATTGIAVATTPPAQATPTTTGEDTPIGTTVIRNHTNTVPMGTVISATLETPIDSSRAGLIRAIVADDTRGFDGKRVLIPRGSRLIGEYAADIRVGQKRVLVTWTRLIRPDGIAVRIGSPGADLLGGSGVPGKVNTFFFQRFAGAVLQSALSIGVNLASRREQGSVFVDLPNTASGAADQSLLSPDDIKPRIRVKEGAALTVFVAHDLDFSAAPVLQRGRGG